MVDLLVNVLHLIIRKVVKDRLCVALINVGDLGPYNATSLAPLRLLRLDGSLTHRCIRFATDAISWFLMSNLVALITHYFMILLSLHLLPSLEAILSSESHHQILLKLILRSFDLILRNVTDFSVQTFGDAV